MYKDNNQPWAKCWANQCEHTATELVQTRKDAFNLVWYCEEDSKSFRENEPSAKVILKLKSDGHGHLTLLERERSK